MQFVTKSARMLIAAIIISILPLAVAADIIVTSPNGNVSASISVASNKLYYRALKGNKPAFDLSSLGITINGIKLGEGVTSISATAPVTINRIYAYRGVKSSATDHCNEITITANRSGAGDQSFQIVFRAYDDGIAYRYKIPGSGLRNVNGEASNWVLASNTNVWYQTSTSFYEGTYINGTAGFFNSWIGMPATLVLPGGSYAAGYALISEAAVFNYSGMSLKAEYSSRVLRGVFEDDNYNATTPYADYCQFSVNGGSCTPWRVTMLVDNLDQLVNSTLIANLAPPPSPELANASWIKSGKCLWSWWAHDGDIKTNPDRQKTYLNYAVNLGFDSVLWDEGWAVWTDSKLNELLTYARDRNKNVWLWKKSAEVWTESAMESFLQFIDNKNALMGKKVIVGIKVDFMNSEKLDVINWYEMAMQKTAAHQLMINFHGANKPTGESVTYPNEVTREGVKGLEYNKWSAGNPPSHNCILPFTRMVVGHADYTPCALNQSTLINTPYPGPTTHCHQLASTIIFTSPLQHWADDPYYYSISPAVELIKACPSTWDETRVLPMSDIGKLSVFARRAGNAWFLAAMNGEFSTPKTLNIPLNFLPNNKDVYEVLLFTDTSANAYSMTKSVRYLTGSDTLSVWLGGGGFAAPKSGYQYAGGCAAMFTPTTGISTCKAQADGTSVTLKGRVVTAAFSGYIYVEEPNRSSGIRVVTNQSGFMPGDVVTITGTMATRKSGAVVMERQITAATSGIQKIHTTIPIKPLMMIDRHLGGNSITDGSGLSTIGLLVKITGRVTGKNGDLLYIDDASGITDPDGFPGVAVKYVSTSIPYTVGDYVSVTGVQEGSIGSDGKTRRFVRVRTASDVKKY